MDLDIQPVRLNSTNYRRVKQLYLRSFPEYEREPWGWLLLKSRFSRADFMAFYDQEKFVGFAYVLHSQGCHYILFLAVDDQVRSQGYGGRIIQQLRHRYGDDQLLLDVEEPDVRAANNKQRLRRIAFYQRNGFHLTAKRFPEEEVTFRVLATKRQINGKRIDQIFEWFAWPLGWIIQ